MKQYMKRVLLVLSMVVSLFALSACSNKNAAEAETMDPQTNIRIAKYNYGYPLFNALDKYTFKLEAYEEYTNYDKKDDDGKYVYEKVPLDSTKVLISNALSADQVVYDDSVDEDEEGVKTSQIL